MDKTAALASDILRGIGGEQNILRLENCMTRVRVEVQDDSQLDIPRLKALPGVSGYVKQGEQHQLIVGPGKAAQVVDAMRVQIAAGGVKPDDAMARTKSEAKAKYKAPMSDALRKLANVFIPLIPAFIASGLITGIINILKRPDIVGDVAVHYPNLLGLMGIFGRRGVRYHEHSGWRQYRESLWRIAGVRRRDGGDPFQPATGADYALWRGASAGTGRRYRRPAGGGVNVLD
ncbi:PTS system IIBC component [Salmonella enterica subsp. enterica]|uniref:PTS system N-acetylmuramic acid-specific EIIBC component n=1 Tax=Salmonella enterica I TaxID=59201 RepID=A0A379W4V0_SALET|nr:PTS system IIBC component [Salmonella enterica subsp. enterica]